MKNPSNDCTNRWIPGLKKLSASSIRQQWPLLCAIFLLLVASTGWGQCDIPAPTNAPTYPQYLVDEMTGQPLSSHATKCIILIHGWNPDGSDNCYGGEFSTLISKLKAKLSGTGWSLVAYDWHTDASTGWFGAITDGVPEYFVERANQAAANAKPHGDHLAAMLDDAAPDLREVQFIAHSAGAHAAKEAMTQLLLLNPYVIVQTTFLDPYIPCPADSFGPFSDFAMDQLPYVTGNDRLQRLENYFADDSPPHWNPYPWGVLVGPTINTQEHFYWRDGVDLDQEVDWGTRIGTPSYTPNYDWHAGPIQFYADTVDASISGHAASSSLPTGSPYDYRDIGWNRSLFAWESFLPQITVQPSDTTVQIGGTVIFTVAASRADSIAWYEYNGNWVGSGSSLTLTNFTGWEARVYVARISNNSGQIFSRPAYVTLNGHQLVGLSLNGPAAVNENTNGQFTATATFNDGSTQAVTAASTWGVNSSAATISASGLLSAGGVNTNTPVTITASYTTVGSTKTSSLNTTIVNTSNGGGTSGSDLIVNGDFSQGTNGWQAAFNFYADNRFSNFHSAGGYAYLSNPDGTPGNNLYGEMAQTINIPANATQATLSYWYRITTTETEALPYDTMTLTTWTAAGGVQTIDSLSNTDANGIYQQRMLDLTRFRGQQVFIDFIAQTDTSNPTTFRIDDVSVQVVVSNPPAPVLLAMSGPSSVPEGTFAQYNATVVYSDGSVQPVAPTWSVNSGFANISPAGLLSAASVVSDIPVTVSATYTLNGVPTTVSKNITILNVPPSFSYLTISGPNFMFKDSAGGLFAATAHFTDGTHYNVQPSWSAISSAVTINSYGVIAPANVNCDTNVSISASYTVGGITCTANQNVFISSALTPLQPMAAPFVWVPFLLSNNVYQPQFVVTWPPIVGLSISNYAVYVDGSSVPSEFMTTNRWTMTPANGLAPNSIHSFQVDYAVSDGRRSPLSPSVSATNWGGAPWGDIPYEWMSRNYGRDINGWPAAASKPGGSGPTLSQIFLSGANPADPTTWLQQTMIHNSQGLFLNWNAQPGAVYQVQRTINMIDWINVGSPRFAGGTMDSIYVGGTPSSYFRVMLLRP